MQGGPGQANTLAEIRRQMQREREEEVGRTDVGWAETEDPRSQLRGSNASRRWPGGELSSRRKDSGLTGERGPSGDHYLELKEQRRAEERHYRGQLHSGDIERQRWGEDEQPISHRVRFEDDAHSTRGRGPNPRRWEDDERDLMQWARNKGRANGYPRNRLPTPPYESPRKQEDGRGDESLRSVSAPVIAEGIAGLGARDNPVALRRRRQEYAEELRAQIREREEARQREKMERQGASPKRGITHTVEAPERRPPGLGDKPPGHSSSRDGGSGSPRDDDRDRSDTVDYSRKPPRPSYDGHERYTPYPAPAPAPRYADYPGYHPQMDYQRPWIPPYYHPRSVYPPPPDFLAESYYPPSQPPPHVGNPYFYHGRLGPELWDPDFRGRRRPEEPERRQRKREESPKHGGTLEGSSDIDTSPLTGAGSGGKATKQSKASYRAELEQQIQEKKQKEAKGRIERERIELKKEAEIYDPWGKGGCGAPVRDNHGNLVTDLKRMRRINNDKLLRGPSRSAATPPSRTPGVEDDKTDFDDGGGSPSGPQYTYSSHEAREKEESEELQKKSQQEEYRDYLRRQVEEKEASRMREKEQKMVEEQRELQRLEKERKVMQDNYQREMEKQQRKEEELRSKNEALKREAEEKRRAAALKRQREELREAEIEAEKRKLALVEKMEQPLLQQRSNSPPIPALMHKRGEAPKLNPPAMEAVTHPTAFHSSSPPVPALQQKLLRPNSEHHPAGIPEDEEPPPPFRTNSPPVPTLRNKLPAGTTANPNPPLEQKLPAPRPTQPPPVEPSRKPPTSEHEAAERQALAEHLRQLKRQLQLQSVTQHGPGKSSSSDYATPTPDDIFDTARFQRPRIVAPRARKPPRQYGSVLSAAVKEFGELKQSTSSKEILANFPSAPENSSMLEFQQGALLGHQETIARLRAGERETSQRASSRGSNLLASESLHIPLSGEDPEVDSLLSVRNPNLRSQRQQWRWDPLSRRDGSAGAQSQFSVATVDIGRLAKRNEERSRRLDAIVKGAEPARDRQTVLHNFLKQTNRTDLTTRRPSEESLDCETRFHPISSAHSHS